MIAIPERQVLLMRRWQPQEETFLLIASFAAESVAVVPPLSPGRWQKVIDAAAEKYGGMGGDELPTVLRGDASHTIDLSPFNFALYRCATEV